MQISVRSYLTAGMTAVVGASAIALAPALPGTALQSVQLPAPAIAEIALTGTSLPLEQIWTLLQKVATAGSLNGVVDVVFGAVGTEFFAQTVPVVTAAANDVATYLGAALMDAFAFGGAQFDLPGIFSGVGTALSHGDLPGALQTLTGGLSAPITHVVQAVFGPAFQDFLTNKVGTVLGALPEILRSAVQKVLGLDIKPVTDAIAKVLSGLVPTVPPAASVPIALAAAAAPTIESTVPAIRPAAPAPQVPVVVAEAPRSAAVEQADAPAKSAPVSDTPAVVVDIPESVAQAEPETSAAPSRAAHRGSAEAGDTETSAAKPAAGHRGAGEASSAAAEHAGR